MASFEERIYELGVAALSDQERQVAEVRGRGATLLAAGAVIASLLAKPVFHGDHPNGQTEQHASAGFGAQIAADDLQPREARRLSGSSSSQLAER